MLGIDETILLAVVEDTTASSLNTYDDALGVSQLHCGGHTLGSVSQHATEGTAEIEFMIVFDVLVKNCSRNMQQRKNTNIRKYIFLA
jgi:hypothetical protein